MEEMFFLQRMSLKETYSSSLNLSSKYPPPPPSFLLVNSAAQFGGKVAAEVSLSFAVLGVSANGGPRHSACKTSHRDVVIYF